MSRSREARDRVVPCRSAVELLGAWHGVMVSKPSETSQDAALMPSSTTEGNSEAWLRCPECEASCRDRVLAPHTDLRCGRCGIIVKFHAEAHRVQWLWAIATAGLLFWVLANVEPILTFSVVGNEQSNEIVTGVKNLWSEGYGPVGVLVFWGAIAAPALHLALVWILAAGTVWAWPWLPRERLTRWVEWISAWNLVPVYAVATLVAVVKLDMLGQVFWKQGAVWVLLLAICSLLVGQWFNADLFSGKRLEADDAA